MWNKVQQGAPVSHHKIQASGCPGDEPLGTHSHPSIHDLLDVIWGEGHNASCSPPLPLSSLHPPPMPSTPPLLLAMPQISCLCAVHHHPPPPHLLYRVDYLLVPLYSMKFTYSSSADHTNLYKHLGGYSMWTIVNMVPRHLIVIPGTPGWQMTKYACVTQHIQSPNAIWGKGHNCVLSQSILSLLPLLSLCLLPMLSTLLSSLCMWILHLCVAYHHPPISHIGPILENLIKNHFFSLFMFLHQFWSCPPSRF